jgi:hypothetical protein
MKIYTSWISGFLKLTRDSFEATSAEHVFKNPFYNELEFRISFQFTRIPDYISIEIKSLNGQTAQDMDFIRNFEHNLDIAMLDIGKWLEYHIQEYSPNGIPVGFKSTGKKVIKLLEKTIRDEFQRMLPAIARFYIEDAIKSICLLDKFVPDDFVQQKLAESRIRAIMDG